MSYGTHAGDPEALQQERDDARREVAELRRQLAEAHERLAGWESQHWPENLPCVLVWLPR